MYQNKFILVLIGTCLCSHILMAHPQAETTFSGSAEGVFVAPSGGGTYSGVGTNYFKYGIALTSQNSLEFVGKSFNVTTPTGYVLGKDAQDRRSLFSIGRLTYHNGTTQGDSNPSGVQLKTSVQLFSPVSAGPTDVSSSLTFNITTNNGNQEENADYVYLPKSFAPITLTTVGGAPITIYPYGFGNASANGFTRLDKFFVYEEESASADFLAKITSSCESIVNGAVKTFTSNNGITMNAIFIPNFQLSLDEAAKLCGYDHFNWVQYITDIPSPNPFRAINNPQKALSTPFLDPPLGGYTYQSAEGGDDTLPYYLGENGPTASELQTSSTKTQLSFDDSPAWGNLPAKQSINFLSALVGTLGNGKFDTLYAWNWKTTFNGTSGGISRIKNIMPVDSHSGTGGITIIKKDLTAIEIPLGIRQLMQKDGARNIETYADLLPVPLLIPVLFD